MTVTTLTFSRHDDDTHVATYRLPGDTDAPIIEEHDTKLGLRYIADVPGDGRRMRYIYRQFSQALAFALGEIEAEV